MKVIIFDTEKEAMDTDYQNNKLTGSVSRYHFHRLLLKATTALTKAEYAELYDIPATITDEYGNEIANPQYEALKDSYTLNKCASLVGDHLDRYDEEGGFLGYFSPYDKDMTTPFNVVKITEGDLLISNKDIL